MSFQEETLHECERAQHCSRDDISRTHYVFADTVKAHVVFQVPHPHYPQNAQASCNVKSDISFFVLHFVLILVSVCYSIP